MIMHSPPSGESVARGGMLGEQVKLSPGHPEFTAPLSGSAPRQVTFDCLVSCKFGGSGG